MSVQGKSHVFGNGDVLLVPDNFPLVDAHGLPGLRVYRDKVGPPALVSDAVTSLVPLVRLLQLHDPDAPVFGDAAR